jgi:hypothetical protein
MCGWKPDFDHYAAFYRPTGNVPPVHYVQLCVTVCPVPKPGPPVPLEEVDSSDPRRVQPVGLQPVGLQPRTLRG